MASITRTEIAAPHWNADFRLGLHRYALYHYLDEDWRSEDSFFRAEYQLIEDTDGRVFNVFTDVLEKR